ncbi:UDP-glucose 4-epimerase GalE [Brevundimonas vesicularis]|nr:UDP-glucose 4-epimerase GalE [Brevundimonas vesicularis]
MGEVGSALTSAKAILVTGGAGYIGAHVCEALAAAGYRPVTYDNLSTGRRRFVRWGPLVEGDVWDADKVRHTLVAHDISAVMHFSGSSVVPESVRAPLDYYRNNVGGLFGLLGGMREAGVNRLVFSSTCAVYGDPGDDPITEATRLAPVTPYGRSKLGCEQILSDASAAHGLNVIALRYFNASGASASGLIGEDRPVETHLIPRAMMALRGWIDDFAVHGTDYPTPDGTAVRDYVHVCDLAQGHLAALSQLLGGRRGFFACNLGAGRGHSVRQVLEAIKAHSGLRLPDAAGARRAGDPPHLVSDITLARRALGFAPRQSDLASIVASAWAWHSRLTAVRASGGAARLSAFRTSAPPTWALHADAAQALHPTAHGPALQDADGDHADGRWG